VGDQFPCQLSGQQRFRDHRSGPADQLEVAGCGLRVAGCGLRVAGLRVAGCRVAGCGLPGAGCRVAGLRVAGLRVAGLAVRLQLSALQQFVICHAHPGPASFGEYGRRLVDRTYGQPL
jgi:hypothetical protein